MRLGTRVARIDRVARRVELDGGEPCRLRPAGAADRRTAAPPAGRHRRRPARRAGDAQPGRCRRDGAAAGGRPAAAGDRRWLHRAGGGGRGREQGPAGDAARSGAAHPAARGRAGHLGLLPRAAPRARRRHPRRRDAAPTAGRRRSCLRRRTAGRPDASRPTWCWSASACSRTSSWPNRPDWPSTTASSSTSSAARSDAAILAAGDCCSFPYRGRRIRLESVQNANDQAAVAAHTVAGKADAVCRAAMVLVGPVRHQAADRRAEPGLRRRHRCARARPSAACRSGTTRATPCWRWTRSTTRPPTSLRRSCSNVAPTWPRPPCATRLRSSRTGWPEVGAHSGPSMVDVTALQARPGCAGATPAAWAAAACRALQRLSGGASQETWSFDRACRTAARRCRWCCAARPKAAAERAAGNATLDGRGAAHRAGGARRCAGARGAAGAAARRRAWARAYVMQHVAGETLGRRIVGDARLAGARAAAGTAMRPGAGAHPRASTRRACRRCAARRRAIELALLRGAAPQPRPRRSRCSSWRCSG